MYTVIDWMYTVIDSCLRTLVSRLARGPVSYGTMQLRLYLLLAHLACVCASLAMMLLRQYTEPQHVTQTHLGGPTVVACQ